MNYIPYPEAISFRSDRLLLRTAYEEVSNNKSKSALQIANEANLKDNYPSGHINRKIRLKMSRIIYNWIESVKQANITGCNSKKRLFTFVTLTLPSKQNHTDKELNKLALNRLIITLQRKHGLIHYLWRAERQKNSNLHYHIICDNYIHYSVLRTEWNSILNSLGYIESYRQNQIEFHSKGFQCRKECLAFWPLEKQSEAYRKGMAENWSNPNTTDIHSLKSVTDAAKYVMKYVSKSDEVDTLDSLKKSLHSEMISQEQYENFKAVTLANLELTKINSRVWGCSDALKSLKDPTLVECHEMYQLIESVEADESSKIILKDEVKIIYCKNINQHISKFPFIKRFITRHHVNQYKAIYGIKKHINESLPPPLLQNVEQIKKPIVTQIQLEMS